MCESERVLQPGPYDTGMAMRHPPNARAASQAVGDPHQPLFVESNYNLIELGPRETGKTYTFRNTSNRSFVVSGGKATPATLFYNKGTRKLGVIGLKHVVFFDEIANTRFDEAESSISVLKDYMQTGKFSRGDQEFRRNAETGHRPTGRHETRGVPECRFPVLGDRVPVGSTVTCCSDEDEWSSRTRSTSRTRFDHAKGTRLDKAKRTHPCLVVIGVVWPVVRAC